MLSALAFKWCTVCDRRLIIMQNKCRLNKNTFSMLRGLGKMSKLAQFWLAFELILLSRSGNPGQKMLFQVNVGQSWNTGIFTYLHLNPVCFCYMEKNIVLRFTEKFISVLEYHKDEHTKEHNILFQKTVSLRQSKEWYAFSSTSIKTLLSIAIHTLHTKASASITRLQQNKTIEHKKAIMTGLFHKTRC